jgi:hypothetical protein
MNRLREDTVIRIQVLFCTYVKNGRMIDGRTAGRFAPKREHTNAVRMIHSFISAKQIMVDDATSHTYIYP